MIDLYWWKDVPNFGDQLSEAIVSWVSGQNVSWVSADQSPKLLAVGSILQLAQTGDTVWGSGIHPWALSRYLKPWPNPPKLNVLAVRGPLTRDALLSIDVDCPAIFGDPAILAPLFYSPAEESIKYELGIIPHFKDRTPLKNIDALYINVKSGWSQVIDQICSCKRIISSSLHGIIIAESYGIPAIWLRSSRNEGIIKYIDYYASTGRINSPCYTLQDALTADPPEIPDLSLAQETLISTLKSYLLSKI